MERKLCVTELFRTVLCISTNKRMLTHAFTWSKTMKNAENYHLCYSTMTVEHILVSIEFLDTGHIKVKI